jgi:outer membrane protein assembly factor BamD (BamD/ComL family)
MLHWLAISALVLIGLAFLLWVATHTVHFIKARQDEFQTVARVLFVAGVLVWVIGGFLQMRMSGNPWFFLRRLLVFAMVLMTVCGRAIIGWIVSPFTNLFDGGGERVKAEPLYSMAETLRRKGKLREAMYAIQEQLEKFPNDFRGQMLLAEIQAENANDLAGAHATIERICSQPKHSPGQIAGALSTLADWHLRFDQDVEAARAALEQIITRFPNTDAAHHASNRLAHLDEAAAKIVDARDPHTIVMKISDEYAPVPKLEQLLPKTDPHAEAERLVQHLNAFPHDTEAREELAKVYADAFGRLDLATEQMESLIASPSESPRRIAHWLNLLADLQVRCTQNTELAGATLNRLIERFPNHPFADVARQRLATLAQEVKRYEKSRVVKLGSS